MATFLVEPYYGESPDREPNDTLENAFETYLPSILVGEISRPGDMDHYKITVKAGEELVFENGATQIGSSLQPVVSILREDQSVVKEFGADGGASVSRFSHKFDKAGTYYVRVTDYQQSGRSGHTYRLKVGSFPLATSAFPLGVEQGKTAEIALAGYRLGSDKIRVKGEPAPGEEDVVRIRPETANGLSFSELRLAVGTDPEVLSAGTNVNAAGAQPVTLPVTVNGRIEAPKNGMPVENYFRFRAGKGQKLVAEVNARRLGSELDSMVEILDAKGSPIEIATVRSVAETSTVLRDHDSVSRGIRLQSLTGFNVGDLVMIGGEVMRIEALPRGPDDDTVFESFGGQRLAFFSTSSEMHAIDHPVYKVQMLPPGAQLTPNGLPVVRLYARNDDGGPGLGKDSRLEFTAPADGDYIIRIRDVRGSGGKDYAYRLNLRQPRPDFRLAVSPRNPNVPVGGAIPLTVTALRFDGFNGPIDVALTNLPSGLHGTHGVIAPGQINTTLLISADADAKLDTAAPLEVAGRGGSLTRYANPEDKLKLIALMPRSDIQMSALSKEVVLEPGGTAEVKVAIERHNGFAGRVPVEVRNLPPRVRVLDVGLNGVLLNEDEKERSFTLEALQSAEPIEQTIYVSGKIETRSALDSSYAAPQPIRVRVVPRKTQLTSR
jgi:hypothetical protein